MTSDHDDHIAYFSLDACDIAEFERLITRTQPADALPHADEVISNIPVYDMARLRPLLEDPAPRRALMAEWAWVIGLGAGVIVLRRACPDLAAIDAATAIYLGIIEAERDRSSGADHFAAAGHNDRIWNSLQKLCKADPETYIRYFANPVIDAACEAWLGPNYQMTAQVNLVHPGGAAQQPHRDYHFGFQSAEVTAEYPAHVHDISQLMTLQGGIAHVDMPIESGPTKLLPFSQLYRPGYLAYRRPDFAACFESHCVQMPLAKGDAFFFNPALFHAAGENRSAGIERFANLLQISSVMGIPMESIDREAMCRQIYTATQCALADKRLPPSALRALIAATAAGYSFPTNLDCDPPKAGLAPETQAALFHRALAESLPQTAFEAALSAQTARRQA